MMSRGGGRGYPRGGSRGGSSYRGGGSYRGSDHSSYNGRDQSRNRYSGGTSYTDSRSSRYDNNRYSRQDSRQDGAGYKRNDSYKQDSRDRRSPDRKRPRTDHTAQGGRREYGTGGTGGSGDYHHRRDSSGGRGGSSSRYHHDSGSSSYDKRGNDHHSSTGGGSGGAGGRDRFDNRSSSRGRGVGSTDRSREPMGPPRSMGPRHSNAGGRTLPPMRTTLGGSRPLHMMSIRRGTTRGRINSHFRNDGRRGIVTTRFPQRRDIRGIPPLRRRFTTIRSRDGGRIGIGKKMDTVSRKALIKRALEAAKELDDDHTTENEGDDDEEADEDKDTTGADGTDSKVDPNEEGGDDDDGDKTEKEEEDDDDAEDKETEKGDEDKEGDKADDSKEDGDGDEDGKKESSTSPKKAVKKSASKTGSEAKSEDKDGEKKKKDTKITTKYRSSTYIKLNCCHCGTKCVTFKEYHTHLFRGLHRAAMRRLAGKTRDKLMEMRQAQRVAQKEADEKVEEGSEQKSSYCVLCQLNFRQPKAVHQKSDGHKEMKRFLMPYCATCKIGFKSPMAYEAHRASLEHLKFKARVERYANKEESGEDGGAEIRLENFMTVDEVGNVDEPTDISKDTSTPKKSGGADSGSTGRPGTDEDDEESDDVDEETIIGSEHVKKVEVQYCDLCNMYLPRREDPEKALRLHCKSRPHLKVYIRNREDKKLRERAERIHKKKLSDAKAKKDAKKGEKDANTSEADASEKTDEKSEKKTAGDKDTTTDEQMWEVVENDLGDLLREVTGPAEDAEEEEDDEKTSSERYDKFRHTEKNGLESNIHDSTVDEEDVSSTEKAGSGKKPANGDASATDKGVSAEA
ncbi:midasin [Sabethes cyaneus]|uniref:midasin n=1 Tax=Sabethes cyaneus TaxID=53552 RepID=UPI00237D94E7|nr:midasin [Sabethes cyaneus]